VKEGKYIKKQTQLYDFWQNRHLAIVTYIKTYVSNE